MGVAEGFQEPPFWSCKDDICKTGTVLLFKNKNTPSPQNKQKNTQRHISSVQLLSHVQLFATPWTVARQVSLSITNSRNLLKLMSIELVMPSSYLILCRPLLLPPSVFPSIRVFSNELALHIRWSKYWSFSFSISPSNDYSALISFRFDWFDLLAVPRVTSYLSKVLVTQSCLTFCDSLDFTRQAPLSMGFSRQEHWSGLPCPLPEDLPDPGTKPGSLASPAVASRFFTISTTWEANSIFKWPASKHTSFFFLFSYSFIYLAAPGLCCNLEDVSLWHENLAP